MVLEVFITIIKNITKAREHVSVTEEIDTRRESTFKVAVAFEEFALNYSKLHLTGTRSPQVIDSHKMGESEHNMVYRPWRWNKFVQITEWEALLLDQIHPSGPSIDYLFINHKTPYYGWFYNILRIALVES